MTSITDNKNKAISTKIGATEYKEVDDIVKTGKYISNSDFVREAIRDKLKALKVIKIREVDYQTAKKEILGYYKKYNEAYISDVANDLELDIELIVNIVEELEKENRLKGVL